LARILSPALNSNSLMASTFWPVDGLELVLLVRVGTPLQQDGRYLGLPTHGGQV
jgi:hypothetical protein